MRGDHVFLRGSVYWFQFRWPRGAFPGLPEEREGYLERFSLQTDNRALAVAEARKRASEIKLAIAHMRAIQRATISRTEMVVPIQDPDKGRVDHADGTWTIATPTHILRFRDGEGGSPEMVGAPEANARIQVGRHVHCASRADAQAREAAIQHAQTVHDELYAARNPGMTRPKKTAAKGEARDTEILDLWIRHRAIRDADAKEARKALTDLRKLHPGVTLETASFTQAQDLGQFYLDSGNLYKVAQKKVRWLSIALKFSGPKIKPPISCNVFVGACPKPKAAPGEVMRKSVKRIPFDEEETARLIAHVPRMREDHQLITLLCATTGMRPIEVCSIVGEQRIDGLRCCVAAAKLPDEDTNRERIIPFPEIVLPYLPEKIEGQLFPKAPIGNKEAMRRYMVKISNKLNDHVRAVVTQEKNKSFYSLRHRAISMLTSKRCPTDIHLEIVGHEEHNGVHRSYIHGKSVYPRDVINEWVKAIWEDFDTSGLRK